MRKLLFLLFGSMAVTVLSRAVIVTVTVGAGGNYFTPSSFTVNAGDTVKWVWATGHHNTSAYSVPAGAIAWYGNVTSIDTVYYFTPVISGLYKYTCTHHSGMDGEFFVNGCTYPATPVITSLNGDAACDGDTIVLFTQQEPGTTLQWINGNTTIQGATTDTLKVTQTGVYKVSTNKCGVDSVSPPFPIAIYQLPSPSFTYTSNGLAYTFINTTTPLSNMKFTWSFSDGSADHVAINTSHTFTSTGTYTVSLQATDSSSTCSGVFSDTVHVALNIDSLGARFYYSVTPNPSVSHITVQSNRFSRILLTDLLGRVMVSSQMPSSRHLMDVSGLVPGIHLLRIYIGSSCIVEKVIIGDF